MIAETLQDKNKWITDLHKHTKIIHASVIAPSMIIGKVSVHGSYFFFFFLLSLFNLVVHDEQGNHNLDLEEAPVWVPDREQKSCMLCADYFSFINRRHHCRNCGKVVCFYLPALNTNYTNCLQVCGFCSQFRMVLAHLTTEKPKRICTFCYHYIKLMEKEKEKEAIAIEAAAATPATALPASSPTAATTPSFPTSSPLNIDPQIPEGSREYTKRALEAYLSNAAHPLRHGKYIAGQGKMVSAPDLGYDPSATEPPLTVQRSTAAAAAAASATIVPPSAKRSLVKKTFAFLTTSSHHSQPQDKNEAAKRDSVPPPMSTTPPKTEAPEAGYVLATGIFNSS